MSKLALRKTLPFVVRAAGELASRVLEFIASDGTVDRDGDIIEPGGWALDTFRKNGVFLWGHDHSIPAIGKPLGADIQGGQLTVPVQFAGTEQGHDLAELVFRLYRDKFLSSVSVGFLPTQWEDMPRASDNQWPGRRFKQQELLELSAVNVPANANAVIVAAQKGAFDVGTREALIKHGFIPKELIEVKILNLDGHVTKVESPNALDAAVFGPILDSFLGGKAPAHGSPEGVIPANPEPSKTGGADVTQEAVAAELDQVIKHQGQQMGKSGGDR